MECTIMGLDTAKRKMFMIGCDDRGHVIFRKSCGSDDLLVFLAQQKPCVLALEACGGSSYWARKIRELGYEVKLVNPTKVSRLRMSQKNDYNDCMAIIEVATRADTKFIAINEAWQQDIQTLHRIRRSVVGRRVELTNQIHGFALEYGVILPEGKGAFTKKLIEELENADNEFSELIRRELRGLYEEISNLRQREDELGRQLESIANESEDGRRLLKVPGVGALSATAFLAAVGDARNFKNGREVSAWLGLVPRQFTTGGNVRLGRISKRGDSYLRQLLVHGGRSMLVSNARRPRREQFYIKMERIQRERGYMKAAIAVANRNARVMWAILRTQTDYKAA